MSDRDKGDSHYEKAVSLRNEGKPHKALDELSRAMQYASKAEYQLERARALLDVGDLDEAESVVTRLQVLVKQSMFPLKVSTDDVDSLQSRIKAAAAPLKKQRTAISRASKAKDLAAFTTALSPFFSGGIGELARPSVRLVVEKGSCPHGKSKLGGTPDLPGTIAWPSDASGKPLSFICQLNLSELPDGAAAELPRSGMLFFFYDAKNQPWGDEADKFKVIFSTDGASGGTEPPEDLEVDSVFSECAISMREELTFLDWGEETLHQFRPSETIRETYEDALKTWYGKEPWHRLGGNPQLIQGSMQTDCHASADSMGWESSLEDWQLLLQLDSDDNAGMLWGDGGRIYYWIRKQDLINHQFDRVWVFLQCY